VSDEALLARYRDLRRGPGPDHFIVEGALAVERLLEAVAGGAELELESIVSTPSQRARLDVPAGVPVVELSRRELAALAGFDFHRGVLACVRRPPLRRELEPWQVEQLRLRPRVTIVVAEGLADPRNLGALVRNAAAFAADLLIADARGADLYARLAIRAGVGNVFRVPTLVSDELPATVAALAREVPASVVAATPDPAARELSSLVAPEKRVLLVGNEGAGLSDQLLALADVRVRIGVAPGSDSLNVAAASAVLLHALGQR
jgi:tRNA G18 (ribose-2'-O)-methylase SpoU